MVKMVTFMVCIFSTNVLYPLFHEDKEVEVSQVANPTKNGFEGSFSSPFHPHGKGIVRVSARGAYNSHSAYLFDFM